ncbi:hypothetical protein ONZ45_g19288 [Pleurotus djamor]|nr:hypothetical protein ONZ45_g19288 [Pleurotus djamor]
MARTKIAAASKSTDGNAPRKRLADFLKSPVVANVPAPKKRTLRTQKTGKSAALTPLTRILLGPLEHCEQAGGSLCCGCHNGGQVAQCNSCNLWVCCSVQSEGVMKGCLVVRSQKDIDDLRFICPRCHIENTKRVKGSFDQRGAPYYGFYVADCPVPEVLIDVRQSMLEFFPRLDTSTTVLLLITLRGCEHMTEPFLDTYHQLSGYFGPQQGTLKPVVLSFDFTDGVQEYLVALSDAIATISDPSVTRVLAFFVAHDSEGGCIQFAPVLHGNDGAVISPGASDEPKAVLEQVFTDALCSAMKNVKKSTLFFFVCKGAEGHAQTRAWMDATVQNPRLGPSTNVVLFARHPDDNTKILRRLYYWTQAHCAPYGVRPPSPSKSQ